MSTYMEIEEAKNSIIDIGKRMYERDYVAANDGNISIRIGDNKVLSTPTGVSKGFMEKETLVVTDLQGNILSDNAKPSSELKMHLKIYAENPNVKSVCHAHPIYCTALSIISNALNEPILAESVISLGGEVPIVPYAKLGSREVPDSISPYINTHYGVILSNHGVVTWGSSPLKAYYRIESMEHYAKISIITTLISNNKKYLSEKEIKDLKEIAFTL